MDRHLRRRRVCAHAWLDALPSVKSVNQSWSQWLQGPQIPWLTAISSGFDWLFSGQVIMVGAAVVFGMLWWRGRRTAALALCAVLAVVAVEVVLKDVLRRPSPLGVLAERRLFDVAVGPAFLQFSFPSGHAARESFVIGWAVLWLIGDRWRGPLLWTGAFLIGFIGWTRIYNGNHWLLDVIAGVLPSTVFLALAESLRGGWVERWLVRLRLLPLRTSAAETPSPRMTRSPLSRR